MLGLAAYLLHKYESSIYFSARKQNQFSINVYLLHQHKRHISFGFITFGKKTTKRFNKEHKEDVELMLNAGADALVLEILYRNGCDVSNQ